MANIIWADSTSTPLNQYVVANPALNNTYDLDGKNGNDTLTGGNYNDTIKGGDDNDSLTGLGGDDRLEGGNGNDILKGGTGNDVMIGGDGFDQYFVDSLSDTITETATGGNSDIVYYEFTTAMAVTMAAHVENALIWSTVGHKVTGNDLSNYMASGGYADHLEGGLGADSLYSGDGTDTLDGGTGADSLVGGGDNDLYIVDDAGDNVVEINGASEGASDEVQASVTYFLDDGDRGGVEKLTLTGPDAIDGFGNSLNNTLTGNAQGNFLSGDAGNDTLVGGAGDDFLDGGTGDDSMVGGTGDDVYFLDALGDDVIENASEGTDTVYSTYTGGMALQDNVENLVMLVGGGAIGNGLYNLIQGSDTADTILGLGGDDTLFGGEDNDNLQGGSNNDALYGDAGSDSLLGGDGNDLLDGGIGADEMTGGTGNDTYYVDAYSVAQGYDTVSESASEGTDTVVTTVDILSLTSLSANVENLTYLGEAGKMTGNALANTITGFQGNDTLEGGLGNDTLIGHEGHDSLDGGGGVDSLIGGAGNDIYIVDSASDVVVELAFEGRDTISTSLTTLNLASHANVENLTFTGAAATGHGTGEANAIKGGANNDTLYGYGGNDTIDGGAGSDSMIGGLGDDIYVLTAGDTVVEASGEGDDWVHTSLTSYTLGSNIEHLRFLGAAATGTGNAEANKIWGAIGNDSLRGGNNNDTLYGLLGNDTLEGEADNDLLYGNTGNDSLSGGTGHDSLWGGEGTDTLLGGDGNDILYGGTGNDVLQGGTGDDIYVFDFRAMGSDTISDTSGTDTVQFEFMDPEQLWFKVVGTDLVITVLDPAFRDTLTIQNWTTAGNRIETFKAVNITTGVTQVLGGADVNDLITAMAGTAVPAVGSGPVTSGSLPAIYSAIGTEWI